MTFPKLLLTTFRPWKPEHRSNASDDLIAALLDRDSLPNSCILLRNLEVAFDLAPCRTIAQVLFHRPEVAVLCGMAEKGSTLMLEAIGRGETEVLATSFHVEALAADLPQTTVSYNAGHFVCNHLYYSVLAAIRDRHLTTRALFVHVPLLTDENCEAIASSFEQVLQRLGSESAVSSPTTIPVQS